MVISFLYFGVFLSQFKKFGCVLDTQLAGISNIQLLMPQTAPTRGI